MGKNKIFKDSTHGYIEIDEIYVKNLIDTPEMQRIKDVSQTGIRSIFSGATHDRFSHSLGVYCVGRRIYDAFIKNVISCKGISRNKDIILKNNDLIELLNRWQKLFDCACLLHDIGHPAYSHTFEYIYNMPFTCFESEGDEVEINDLEINRFTQRILLSESIEGTYLQEKVAELIEKSETNLLKDILSLESDTTDLSKKIPVGKVLGQPHELMSAYLILTRKEWKDRIENVTGNGASDKVTSDCDLAFIARMITGNEYNLADINVTQQVREELSLRNCVISLLNGKIDADSIDYLDRNSHFAGYSTTHLDTRRLCSGFSVYFDSKDKLFKRCLDKSALSAIDGFVQARNFEPKWLYNHHKIVYYNDFLIKFLLKISGQLFFAENRDLVESPIINRISQLRLPSSDLAAKEVGGGDSGDEKLEFDKEMILNGIVERLKLYSLCEICETDISQLVYNLDSLEENLTRISHELAERISGIITKEVKLLLSSDDGAEFNTGLTRLNSLLKELTTQTRYLGDIKVNFTSYLVALDKRVKLRAPFGGDIIVDSWSDSHFHKLFLDFGVPSRQPELKNLLATINKDEQDAAFKATLFCDVLEEYRSRKYRESLWKSYEEYKLFLNEIAAMLYTKEVGYIHEAITALICTGNPIDFEDLQGTKSKAYAASGLAGEYLRERVFCNWYNANEEPTQRKFNKVFGCLGKGMIIRFHECRFKDFSSLKVKFHDGDNGIYNYGEINYSSTQPDFYFPYIYYSSKYVRQGRQELLVQLRDNLVDYIKEEEKKMVSNLSKNAFDKGKIIRDPVHGDIFVPDRFLKILDCKVVQRLRRIKQLAVADMIFPEAVHTRFAHSLGAFHITNLMLNHICELLDNLKISYTQKDKDVILAAALLHDLGHGPFSHAYEDVCTNAISHEEWTCKIINNDSELKQVLNSFGDDFLTHVTNCLNKNGNYNKTMLWTVFSELVSSNLDADRMDYLMRDVHNTGEKYGTIDLQKLISSLELIESNGCPKLALREDAIPAVEQMIIGRYNMYSEVYYAPYKLAQERLLGLICERIKEICAGESNLITAIIDNTIDVQRYVEIDDNTFVSEIKSIANKKNDDILNLLLSSFDARGKYVRIRIDSKDVKEFKRDLDAICKEKLERCLKYSFMFVGKTYNAYDCSCSARESEIFLISNSGVTKKFSETSKLFNNNSYDGAPLWLTMVEYVYFNRELLQCEIDRAQGDREDLNRMIDELIASYDACKQTEIENKFYCTPDNFEELNCFGSLIAKPEFNGFEIEEGTQRRYHDAQPQIDTYYDTPDFLLARKNLSLRCRVKEDSRIFTLKVPVHTADVGKDAQFIRREFDGVCLNTANIDHEIKEFLWRHNTHFSDFVDMKEKIIEKIRPVLKIKTRRKSFLIVDSDKSSNFACEVSLDDIEYNKIGSNEGQNEKDYQVEIELKCKYTYRLRMSEFAKKLCGVVGIDDSKRAKESKYLRGLYRLNLGEFSNR